MSTSTTMGSWPAELPAVQMRFARPTGRLDDITAFYGKILGLPLLHRSEYDDWTVVMFGLPGDRYNLEFVAHIDGIDGTAPSGENLQVFYFDNEADQQMVAQRLRGAGIDEIELDNPWWGHNGALAFPDPDGWRIVLMPIPVPLIDAAAGAHNVRPT
jgi:catechol 2,3-dioxygenase-like lactoylglutathione lyase family enzyme